jgi:ABC-type proline/glycine betaine transport system substrate-binding protein
MSHVVFHLEDENISIADDTWHSGKFSCHVTGDGQEQLGYKASTIQLRTQLTNLLS